MDGKITNIIFDLGGVIIDLNSRLCKSKFKEIGVNLETMITSSDYSDSKGSAVSDGFMATGLMNVYQVGMIETEDFVNEILSQSKSGISKADFIDAWNSCLATIPTFKIVALQELKRRGYKIHLLSNTNDLHWKCVVEKCFHEGVEHYFDNIFLSHELHLAKPDVSIFQEVISRLSVKPEECLFIDDVKENCEAAASIGISTIKAEAAFFDERGSVVRPDNEWPAIIDFYL